MVVKPLEYADTIEDFMFRLNLLGVHRGPRKHAKAHYVIPYTKVMTEAHEGLQYQELG